MTKKAKKKKNEKLVSALAYLLIGIIWFFADEDISKSKLAKFHVKQAINLWLFLVLIQIVANLMFLFGVIFALAGNILVIVLLVIGLSNAVEGKKKFLPLVGKFAEKYLDF
ncbi:MAG: hypothetical protein ACQESF_03280 [Nanobdellota archaeon]